ncbi:MAG: hypothetical protein JW839_04575 [Candidatus Lokiarchaeota archaeon]|nr:hypothetical protein [Candidatus Lokiarchaeota archaeon]
MITKRFSLRNYSTEDNRLLRIETNRDGFTETGGTDYLRVLRKGVYGLKGGVSVKAGQSLVFNLSFKEGTMEPEVTNAVWEQPWVPSRAEYEKDVEGLRWVLLQENKSGINLASWFSLGSATKPDDANLITGFCSAVSGFGNELNPTGGTSFRSIHFDGMHVVLLSGKWSSLIILATREPGEAMINRLQGFLNEYERDHEKDLEAFDGRVGVFSDFKGRLRSRL